MIIYDLKNIAIPRVPSIPVASGEREHEPAGAKDTTKKVSKEKDLLNKIKEVVKDISKMEQHVNTGIRLEIEKDLNIVVVKIVDKESGEVIRQVPLPESIELSKNMKEQLSKMVEDQSGILMYKEV
ncbi:MAG: flagellar protein FlaG [Desulfobacterales bacterium]|nr:flagellar protein FlaG [Desulfobacterales bacterium]